MRDFKWSKETTEETLRQEIERLNKRIDVLEYIVEPFLARMKHKSELMNIYSECPDYEDILPFMEKYGNEVVELYKFEDGYLMVDDPNTFISENCFMFLASYQERCLSGLN